MRSRGVKYCGLILVGLITTSTLLAYPKLVHADIAITQSGSEEYWERAEISSPHSDEITLRGNPGIISSTRQFFNALGPCVKDILVSCISGIWIKDVKGAWIAGEYQGMMTNPPVSELVPDVSSNVGAPQTSNLFKFPGIVHSGGTLFAVNPVQDYCLRTCIDSQIENLIKVSQTHQLPGTDDYIERIRKNYRRSTIGTEIFPVEKLSTLSALKCERDWLDCKVSGWKRATGDSPFTYRLEILRNEKPTGWMSGRMLYPNVIVTEMKTNPDNQRYKIVIEGSEATVPAVSVTFNYTNPIERSAFQEYGVNTEALCPTLYYTNSRTPNGLSMCFEVQTDMWTKANQSSNFTSTSRPRFSSPYHLAGLIKAWPNADRATAEDNMWNFSWQLSGVPQTIGPKFTQDQYLVFTKGKCKNVEFFGSAFSNSTLLDMYIPLFDSTSQSFELQVASPHYLSSGDVATGFYEFVINEQVARCIWGIGDAPYSISLNVLTENGVDKKAVTTVSKTNGFIKFSFTGFTYSAPKLVIKVFKKGATICVKGKLKMLPKNAKSRCLDGWKKSKA
jgi:hypothetical protein